MSTHIGFCWVEEPEFYDPFATRTLPCFSCRRSFATLDNLRQHLRSRVHLGRGIQCVFCDRGFTTASGVVHHLELGACPRAAGLDRDTIFGFMKNADPLGYVTNVVDQVEPGVFPKDRNGTQVYACTVCKMEYPTSDEAMRHVAAAHPNKCYHCPNTVHCNRQYARLAAAVNHLESGSCGFTSFACVQSTVRRGMRHYPA